MLLNCTVIAEESKTVAAESGISENAEAVNTDNNVPEDIETTDSEAAPEDEYANAFNIYVDPKSEGEENTYRTISAAIAAVRSLDKSKQQVVVNIAGGSYRVAETIAFTYADSGSSEYPVIYRAKNGEHVVLEAGEAVQGTVITDKDSIYKKLPQSMRSKVYKIDLSKHKTEDLGNLDAGGANMGGQSTAAYGSIINLIYNDTMMKTASYPNIGSEHIISAVGENQFSLEDTDVPVKSWDMSSGNGWVQTIANNGYIYGQGKLVSYDSSTGMITGVNVPGFTFTVGGRVRFKNLPEFIDQPGEYIIDFNNKCIYFYSPDEKMLGSSYVTTFKKPIMSFENCENVIIDGLTLQNGGGDGVQINASKNCTVRNCTIKNLSGNGVNINSSTGINVKDCNINNVGLNGVYIGDSGDHKTLTPDNNIVEGCDIYSTGRIAPVGLLGIKLYNTTGTKLLKNRLHDIPHTAIMLTDSTACTVEKNEIYNAVNDTYDAGAIYIGASKFKGVGNVFKNNYIHDIYLTEDAKGGATVGLYWDDQVSGQTAFGNIFDDNSLGMLVGGGDWNTVDNNIFYKTRASLTYDNRGHGWQTGSATNLVSQYESEVGVSNALWQNTYPYTKTLYEYAKAGDLEKINAPDRAVVKNNLSIEAPNFDLAQAVKDNAKEVSNNIKVSGDYIKFADSDNYDFSYSADEKIKDIPDFEYIDFSEIGIEKKQLGKTQILSPKNGAENVEGNCAVLSWKDTNGADRYRVRVYMYSDNTAMVYDNTVTGTSVELDNLKYGKTYYWNVEPIVSSKSEYGGIVSDTYSFSTAKTEMKSTDKLEEALDYLGDSWRRVKEGSKPGQYQPGAVAELDKTVSKAEKILYDGASKMFSIKSITAKLNAAIKKFNDSQNLEIVDMGDWLRDTANWSLAKGSKIENGALYMHNDIAGYGGATLSRSQLLRMKIKLDFTNYQGFGLNQQDPSNVFWADSGYAIVIKRDQFEIQRYTDKSSGIIATFSNDESKLTSDVWYTVDVGLLSTPLGPRILLKTGDKVLIDYIDRSGEKADQLGYVSFQDGSGTTGMYVAGSDYTE